MRRARTIVRQVSGIVLAKRILLDGLTIPAESAANYDNPLTVDLLECTETQDEEVESNGTAIADTPLYSRILAIRLNFSVAAGAANQTFRWILAKSPDNDIAGTAFNSDFHSSNDAQNSREIRKNIIAKGLFTSNASSNVNRVPVFVRKKALARISPLREGDVLRFVISQNSGTAASLHGFGTIWVRANA